MTIATYYPITALKRDGYPVFFPIPDLRLTRHGDLIEQMKGADVVGLKRTFRKGRPTECVVYQVRRESGHYEDLPKFMHPTLFRPMTLAKYPDPLPEPAAQAGEVDWSSEHPPLLPPDDPLPLDWIGPYAMPPNISREEVEVRVMRGLKTERAKGVDDQGLRGPKAYGTFIDGMLGGGNITIQGWVPDKRDIGDWLQVREWLRAIDRQPRSIIEWKSIEYSFWQIGERLRPAISREWARVKYNEGMEAVWRVANRKT